MARVWAAAVLLALVLAGCRHPEAVSPALLVLDGRELPRAASITGKTGFRVDAKILVEELQGEIVSPSEGTVLITLQGKRIVWSWAESDLPHDIHIKAAPRYDNGVLTLYGKPLSDLIKAVFPEGKVYRVSDRVHIETRLR